MEDFLAGLPVGNLDPEGFFDVDDEFQDIDGVEAQAFLAVKQGPVVLELGRLDLEPSAFDDHDLDSVPENGVAVIHSGSRGEITRYSARSQLLVLFHGPAEDSRPLGSPEEEGVRRKLGVQDDLGQVE